VIGRLWVLSQTLWRAFRARGRAMLLLVVYPVYWAWISLGQGLDRLLFTGPRGIDAPKTIVIAGPPRSGTTFLHRFLAEHGAGRPTELWEALVPAVTWQRLLRPAVSRLARRGWPALDLGPAHEAGLRLPETDDLVVFSRHLDSFFYFVYALSFGPVERPEYLDPALRPAEIAPRDMACLAAAARRNRINGGTPVALLKSFAAGYALDEVRGRLPGARIVYVSRAPHETLPSSLSMVRSVLGVRGLYERCDAVSRQRHVARILRASLAMQQAAVASLRRLPGDEVLIVRHEDLVTQFAATMHRILAFVGEPADARWHEVVVRQDRHQRRRRSAHRYSLEEFGLDERRVRDLFREVYEFFGHA